MAKLAFTPNADGFAFPNAFTFGPSDRATLAREVAPAIDGALALLGPLGVAGRVVDARTRLSELALAYVPDRYGLCGGMAFAALDYYHAGLPVPRAGGPQVPAAGSSLQGYLWGRLLDSWRLNGVTFLEWKARLCVLPQRWPFDPGRRALRDRSRAQWTVLTARIDAGEPIALGLVSEARDPFQDHQVLAYGYEATGRSGGRIYVYDSPDAEQTIDVDWSGEPLRVAESCDRGVPTRGFFCEAYRPVIPPDG